MKPIDECWIVGVTQDDDGPWEPEAFCLSEFGCIMASSPDPSMSDLPGMEIWGDLKNSSEGESFTKIYHAFFVTHGEFPDHWARACGLAKRMNREDERKRGAQ